MANSVPPTLHFLPLLARSLMYFISARDASQPPGTIKHSGHAISFFLFFTGVCGVTSQQTD